MLLCRVSAVSHALARWGRRSHREGGLRYRALLFSSSRCHGVCTGEGSAQPAEAGSTQGLYRDTVLLPRTEFPMKLAGQKLLDRELQIQQVQQLDATCLVISFCYFLLPHPNCTSCTRLCITGVWICRAVLLAETEESQEGVLSS